MVFLDAATPLNGHSLFDVAGPVIDAVRPFGETVDGMELVLLPAPDAGLLYEVTDLDDLAWMAERLTGILESASSNHSSPTDEAALGAIPGVQIVRTSTLATRDPALMAMARAEGRRGDIDTGHDLTITEPKKRLPRRYSRSQRAGVRNTRRASERVVAYGPTGGQVGLCGEERTAPWVRHRSEFEGGWALVALVFTAGAGIAGLAGGTAGAAATSGAAVTLVMITALRAKAGRVQRRAGRLQRADRAADAEGGTTATKSRAASSTTRRARPRSPSRPGRRFEEPGRHRVGPAPAPPRRQVPQQAGSR